ncbi:ABC-2 type transport system ATP-binding protein [Ruminococcus sp. YRD2003]|uniref:ABC transporter ATP-binding protein n=1 Tax=Ruminococcus sp. YRD2003 TaxID=1452313 RepID=UPI0008D45B11|nr:ABC-2 type transport system ATP-binding protein [Ruminococcus flavefaciens]
MITIEKLTKYYGTNRAVNNISFTINDNEILGFLGPNGAGKSTTMNMIAGYLPMSAGRVTIYGSDISKEPVAAKKNIGYLPEIPPVYPDMRVREYLSFCAGLKRIRSAERKDEIARVMKLLKIEDVQDKLIKNLSKGYKQRVGFAQALLGDPKFLIFDEPTVGLDPNQVIEVRNIIKGLKKDHSVIFSSHILSEVSAVCDRVVIINKGDIKAVDTIENLEKKLGGSLTLRIKIKGDRTKTSNIIELTDGVQEIASIDAEGNDFYAFAVKLKEGAGDDVKNNIMAELIKHGIQISEIYTEKPDLEAVFVDMINRSAKNNGLLDLLDEIEPVEAPETEDDEESAADEEKEDKE